MAEETPGLAVWGGMECTINRVCDEYFDQFALGNVYAQPASESIADLGISKLRFPVLWERHEPTKGVAGDWSFTDGQLNYYRSRGIDIIATLVHHGSGPSFTGLLDPDFPHLLATYARRVAERYPWVSHYTPVNEPLTTARFSGLYGFWYPHHASDESFLRCLLHQLKGTVLAMAAIREVNPAARLVQTEDLGKTYSTPLLRYQARFENERRWLTYDLLCGRVDEQHPLWNYFLEHRAGEEDLRFFLENPCPPDVFGFNYYVTSERFIDERLERYPHLLPGGNGRQRYVDTEAARVPVSEPTGAAVLLREAWRRYGAPMALTEVHLHCHREEQLRWFRYILESCQQLRAEGVGIHAVTAWALLGSYGWNRVLTGPSFDYEPGAFDLRSGKPRPTALARYIRSVGDSPQDEHIAAAPGWWLRDTRYVDKSGDEERCGEPAFVGRPILIIGKRGTLGRAFARVCYDRALPTIVAGREDCDITSAASIAAALERYQPWAVINAAGYVRVDDAEADAERCLLENHIGPALLAAACDDRGIRLLSFSSDLVFDGGKDGAYVESDRVNPLNVYGESKALAERDMLERMPEALMVRTSAFFSPWDRYNFVHWVEERLGAGIRIPVAGDLHISPTYVPDLVHQALDLLVDREKGIWHLANPGRYTWADLARKVAEACCLDGDLLDVFPAKEMGWPARRPHNSVLGSEKALLLPDTGNALNRYFAEKTASEELVYP
ncbi:NAD-dependent epimerase/dehydratase family protein [Flaviaesturariibacter flavus]|uniref:dTDP-4-dehydrorhamnose reductase n=1 Tax=Flaviaesturariibacter flavus TaxID=2502780 RepID=A0A4R1BNY2_9BACT|nr:sugar nucleotide-binding protein [Flaviaesturariibacter flavus]TCJ19211.1 NAD-dependent epimerase/dehydratase family protein [Flaviaesturariibacter flavus]